MPPRSCRCVYFCFVCHTTLGYRYVTPVQRWRFHGPITEIDGALLFGWSTAHHIRSSTASSGASAMTSPLEPGVGRKSLRHVSPVLWLSDYRTSWLAADLAAGVTLAAYAIPVALAYAELAGFPPQVGVYGYTLGGLGYALLGSSRQLAIGPTSAMSLMVAGTVGAMADADTQRYAHCDSRGLHRGRPLPDRVAVAAQRADAANQRQHPGGVQGRCWLDDHHEPTAEFDWRCRRWAQFLRAGSAVDRSTQPNSVPRARAERDRGRTAPAG